MGEQDNLQTVKRIREALLCGDLPTLLNFARRPRNSSGGIGEGPSAHPWRGRKEVANYFKTIAAEVEFQEYETDEFSVGWNCVVVLGHERCPVCTTGRVVEAKWVQIFDFSDGLVCRHREYTDTAAWDAGFQWGERMLF
jgi:ketosteroid isomerase-like protein